MGFMWQWRRGGGYIQGSHHCPPTTTTYYNNENNYVHFLGHLNSTGRPPLTKSWDYRCAICTASFCSAGDQTRTFMHARQAHYQVTYLTPKEFFSDNILHFLKGQVELKMLLADWACKRFCSSATLIEKRKEGRERESEGRREEGRKDEWTGQVVLKLIFINEKDENLSEVKTFL